MGREGGREEEAKMGRCKRQLQCSSGSCGSRPAFRMLPFHSLGDLTDSNGSAWCQAGPFPHPTRGDPCHFPCLLSKN